MPKRKRPPRDSWVAIDAGSSHLFDIQAMQSEATRLTRFGREVRGALLASAYEIESVLDQVLLGIFSPGQNDAPSEQRELFDDWLLKASRLNFSRKVELLSACRKQISRARELVSDELVKDIQKVRGLRNDFAHYPVEFRPVEGKPVVALRAVFVGSEHDMELTDQAVKTMVDLFASTMAKLEELLRSLNDGAMKTSSNNALNTDGLGQRTPGASPKPAG